MTEVQNEYQLHKIKMLSGLLSFLGDLGKVNFLGLCVSTSHLHVFPPTSLGSSFCPQFSRLALQHPQSLGF